MHHLLCGTWSFREYRTTIGIDDISIEGRCWWSIGDSTPIVVTVEDTVVSTSCSMDTRFKYARLSDRGTVNKKLKRSLRT